MGALHWDAPDLVGQIGGVLNQCIGVDQFWRWFVAAMPTIEDHGDDAVVDLAWRVEHRFAEYTSGYIDAERLTDALRRDLDDSGMASPVGREDAEGGRLDRHRTVAD